MFDSLIQETASRLSPDTGHKGFEYRFGGGNLELQGSIGQEAIVGGPADTGKTMSSLYILNQLCWKYSGIQASIIRKVYSTIVPSVMQTYMKKIVKPGDGIRYHGGEKSPSRVIYPNGSVIWLAGMDSPGKTLSSERDIIYVNQAEELNLIDWETLRTRASGRAGNAPIRWLFGDCNPGPPSHWIKSLERKGVLKLLEATHKDNPELFDPDTGEITEAGIVRLEALQNLTGVTQKRLYLGLWVAPAGAIYEVFEKDKHQIASFPIPEIWPRAVGIDPYGAYIAAVWVAFDPAAKVLHVYREYMEPYGLTTPEHARRILRASGYNQNGSPLEMGSGENIIAWAGGGPSENQARLDFTAAGIPLLEPGVFEVWAGIDRVIQLLKDFTLVIHDDCPNLLNEIGTYQRVMKNGEATNEIENKTAFHCLVGDTLVTTERGDIPIRDILPGDMALTRKGYRKVLDQACTNPSAKVYKVVFSNGEEIVGTGEHLIYANGEWKRLDALRYDDIIVTSEDILCSRKPETPRRFQYSAGYGENLERTNTINGLFRSTYMCGKCIMAALSQKVIKSIILTLIQKIMKLKISLPCPRKNIFAYICQIDMISRSYGNLPGLVGNTQKHGTPQKREEPFIHQTGSLFGKMLLGLSSAARIAERNSRLGALQIPGLDFAQTIASQQAGENQELITPKECACFAAINSSGTNTVKPNIAQSYVLRVIELDQKEAVYNLEIEGEHEFFANGILVHNCLDALRYVISWLTGGVETVQVGQNQVMQIGRY